MYIYHNELMCFTDAIKLFIQNEPRAGVRADVRKALRRWETAYRLKQGHGCECYALWCAVLGGTGLALSIPSRWSYENRLIDLEGERKGQAERLVHALFFLLDDLSCDTNSVTKSNRLVEFILAMARLCEVDT